MGRGALSLVLLAAMGACSSFSGSDAPAPADDGGGAADGARGADATSDADAGAVCPDKTRAKTPSTVGFFDATEGSFKLFGRDVTKPPILVKRSPGTVDVDLPIASHQKGEGDTVGWYAGATNDFTVLAENRTAAAVSLSKNFGANGTVYRPFTGDWDKGGASLVGVQNPATNAFFLYIAGGDDRSFQFGLGATEAGPPVEGRPFAGDWDGDGSDGIGMFLPSTGDVFLKQVAANGPGEITLHTTHAGPNVWPVAGDWDGCGGVRPGLYDADTRQLYLLLANAALAAEEHIDMSPYVTHTERPIAGRWKAP